MQRIVSGLFLFFVLGAGTLSAQDRADALASYRSENYQDAVEICLREIEAMPRNMDSYTVLGWSLIALERYEDALKYGLNALKIAPRDSRINEILGESNYYLGRNLDALNYFEQYAVLAPTGGRTADIYFFMGEIFIRLEEYNHADIALSTAVYHSSESSTWWSRLGYAREMAGDYRYALEAYQKSLALNPSLTEARRGRDRVSAQFSEN